MTHALTTQTAGHDFAAIDRANLQPSTKLQYKKAVRNMLAAGIDPRNHSALAEYASGLASSSRQFLKSALRLLTAGTIQTLKGNATPENLNQVQASLYRLEAMQEVIQVEAHKGEKAHLWLTPAQVQEMTALCDDTPEGRRDWIVLGVLLGAGLRREELAGLTFSALKAQPAKDGNRRFVLQVKGKGAKDRVIPISALLARRLKEWQRETGGGSIARSFKNGQMGESLSPVGIFMIVQRYGSRIGLPELAPHDLRRTFAQLGYNAGIPLSQVSKLLGHSSILTTQQYLNLEMDLDNTASDHIPLSGD